MIHRTRINDQVEMVENNVNPLNNYNMDRITQIPKFQKPPLGLVPKHIWEEQTNTTRFNEVCRAISDYWTAGLEIKIEWVEEYNDLLKKMKI